MEKNVTAEVVLLRNNRDTFELGVTLFGERRLVSGQFKFRFDSLSAAHAHLLLDFGLQLSSDDMDKVVDNEKVTVPVNFEQSSDLFEEIHYQFSIYEEADFFGSYKEPIAQYSLIDATGRDFAGELAPKDSVNEIANAIKDSGRDSSFYFLAYDDKPNEPIIDVHFLTKDEIYLRKNGRWKVINPVEWDKQDGSMEWLINPERGVEFLRAFDQGGMTVGEGQMYSLPDRFYSDARRDSDEPNSSNPLRSINTNSNLNSNNRDYFHCVVYENEIHVHRIKDAFKPVSSDEFSEFGRDGGYLLVGQSDWLMILPRAVWRSTDDFSGVFEDLMEELPEHKNPNMSCSDWIEFLNGVDTERFEIDKIPMDIKEGPIDSAAKRFIAERLSSFSWEIYRGNRLSNFD